ncbi:sulfatase family protein [Pontiella sulfatireligans]|uniref:Arylsulfatase n=1 Tax=Pontiella sulfatireligans TaxID=2750658 RepID=A0A6C2UJ46_9BACT|nr:arylsulfatase [Pontiella sulfatireligans]SPS74299.1 sulfatase S1_15 [Kiritimatiellales bacterium]VGO19226.1 Arylsulfatase [Pontiella sulfatireligans]
MKRIILLLTVAMASVAVHAGKPNIVFILADDMGVGDVSGLNPDAKLSTPNLDSLIQKGMHFTDAHTSSAVCTPTRYGLMTGRYNWRSELKFKVVNGYGRAVIAPDRDTVADLLKRNGYKTAMIGKWHLGLNWKLKDGSGISDWRPEGIEDQVDFTQPFSGGPIDCGFDWYYGINASLDFPPYTFLENDHVTKVPTELRPKQGSKENKQIMMRSGLQVEGFRPELVLKHFTEKAVAFIAEQKADNPFFLYLPLNAPHTPVLPRDEFKGSSECGIYGDFIQEIDWAVGQVLQALEKQGLLENTLLVFTADNGASNASFSPNQEKEFNHKPSYIYKGRKGSLDEGGHRVPYIVHWPAAVKPDSRCDMACCLNDLYATCAELVGETVAENAGEDSFSMMPLLKGQSRGYERNGLVHHDLAGRFALRDGRWKLQFHRFERKYGLYDMENDPEQENNLYAAHPEIVKQLETKLTQLVMKGRSSLGTPQKNDGPEWWEQLTWMDQK